MKYLGNGAPWCCGSQGLLRKPLFNGFCCFCLQQSQDPYLPNQTGISAGVVVGMLHSRQIRKPNGLTRSAKMSPVESNGVFLTLRGTNQGRKNWVPIMDNRITGGIHSLWEEYYLKNCDNWLKSQIYYVEAIG